MRKIKKKTLNEKKKEAKPSSLGSLSCENMRKTKKIQKNQNSCVTLSHTVFLREIKNGLVIRQGFSKNFT